MEANVYEKLFAKRHKDEDETPSQELLLVNCCELFLGTYI